MVMVKVNRPSPPYILMASHRRTAGWMVRAAAVCLLNSSARSIASFLNLR